MKLKLFFAVCILTVQGCGGGGGGSGDSGPGQSARTGVRILHGAIDYGPVQVSSSANPESIVTTAHFAESTLYGQLSEGEQNITMSLRNTPPTPVDIKPISVEESGHYSFLLFGNELAIGLETAVISDNPGEIPSGKAAVKVVHALVGASGLNVSYSDGQSAENINFGSASPYVFIPGGVANVNISRASDGFRASTITNTFEAGKVYTILMTGEIEFFLVARILED